MTMTMEKKPRYSVVIPLYNKQETIEKTVRSVLAQDEPDFEIIVVDDGSTDSSYNAVRSMDDARIHLLSQENGGVSVARNSGIRNAVGDIICFLDADDLWKPNFLSEIGRLFHMFPEADLACTSYQVCYANDRIVHPQWRSVDLDRPSVVRDFYEMATAPFWVMNSSCLAVKRQALEKMDEWYPVGESVYEDFEFYVRMGSRFTVAHSDKVCVSYQRITVQNARTQHRYRVVYSKRYMETLNRLFAEEKDSQRKKWIRQMIDRRMVPYVYSLLLCRKRAEARRALKNWKADPPYVKYRVGLIGAAFAPGFVIDIVQRLRYHLF